MTINEIETTLQNLATRHPNLDEKMLLTLLASSGWEDKNIQEAVLIFKGSHSNLKATEATVPKQQEEVIPPVVVSGGNKTTGAAENIVFYDATGNEEKELKQYAESYKDIPVILDQPLIKKDDSMKVVTAQPPITITKDIPITPQKETVKEEPQSLVIETTPELRKTPQVELPENLPLRPFESASHVWPLSKYKDVFHGTTPPFLSSQEEVLVKEHKDEHTEEHKHKVIKFKRTGFDGEDEGLIFLTGSSLFVIIILLVYMYSNGRL